jgi:hypothetical protein
LVNALDANTTASNNTAVGTDALDSKHDRCLQYSIGMALSNNTTALTILQLVIALEANTTGAIILQWVRCFSANTTASNNVAVGKVL